MLHHSRSSSSYLACLFPGQPVGAAAAASLHSTVLHRFHGASATTISTSSCPGMRATTNHLRFMHDGVLLSTHNNGTIGVWHTPPCNARASSPALPARLFQAHNAGVISCIDLQPQSHLVATGGMDGWLHVWNMEHPPIDGATHGDTQAPQSAPTHHTPIRSFDQTHALLIDCCFPSVCPTITNRLDSAVASISSDECLCIWPLNSKLQSMKCKVPPTPTSVRFSIENPNLLMTLHQPHAFYLWDIRKLDQYCQWFDFDATLQSTCASPLQTPHYLQAVQRSIGIYCVREII
jgi:WD40 repeat protein